MEEEGNGVEVEGEGGVENTVAAGCDAASCFQPGVGAFDGPAVACLGVAGFQSALFAAPDLARWCACGDRVAAAAGFADPRLDLPLAQGLVDRFGGVAAVCPELAGPNATRQQLIHERQQMSLFVFVAGGEPHRKRGALGVYCEVETAALAAPECARDLRAPFFASTSEASTITRDQSSFPASASSSCKTLSASANSP